jgi:hypothetical protein
MTSHDILGVVLIVASLLVWGMAFATIAYVIYCAKQIITMDHAERVDAKNNR